MPRGDNNRKLSEEQRDEIVRLYVTRHEDGAVTGAPTIARIYGVSTPTVRAILRSRGIASRSMKDAQANRIARPRKRPEGEAPRCKCGCGQRTYWRAKRACWSVYASGHYRRDAPYKREDWLRGQYVTRGRTIDEIAEACGVTKTAVRRYMRRFAIETRDASAAHVGRQTGKRNPAWQGGVADWPYTSDWKRIARRVRERADWTCQDCSRRRQGRGLHVHHVDGDKLNNAPENLVALCAACHRARHAL